jgi:hypothetical protein
MQNRHYFFDHFVRSLSARSERLRSSDVNEEPDSDQSPNSRSLFVTQSCSKRGPLQDVIGRRPPAEVGILPERKTQLNPRPLYESATPAMVKHEGAFV